MKYDDNNIFAQIINGTISCKKVFEDQYTFSFHDIMPQAPIHILVVPKQKYISLDDFSKTASDAEIVSMTRAIGLISRDFDLDVSGYRMIANHGTDAHQEVLHYHVHVLGGKNLGGILKNFQ
jgi:diadenosine tetraphosphate (Ap4A) HIT family hydrolase